MEVQNQIQKTNVCQAKTFKANAPTTKENTPEYINGSIARKTNLLDNSWSYEGNIGNSNFNIKNDINMLDLNELSGTIGDKPFKLEYDKNLIKSNVYTGSIGNQPINLKISNNKITGRFKDKNVYLTINKKFNKCTIEGENTKLQLDGNILDKGLRISGNCGTDKDLIPILMSVILDDKKQNDMIMAAAIAPVAVPFMI